MPSGDAKVMTDSGAEERDELRKSGTYHVPLQAGNVCFWDEEHWVSHMVSHSLEEGAFAADRAAHYGLVCWGKNIGRSIASAFSL